ncbi:Hsp90 cochaperone [Tieghemiomyces parasiticus]|uniref:Hsp90 cochaperone n=1 Tax=Tieghemiomyces parasiticus TaxID=78921 RepID=A0A9W7ZZG0_9FUNG|nr:Hsp90 cochaperone [Tieghemiomyces parasiticus]
MATADELKQIGNQQFSAGQYDAAVETFGKAIELAPENHVLYSNRSAAYASAKKYTEALADAEKTVEVKPDWPKGYGRKGAALYGLDRLEDAREAFNAGLALDPNNAQLRKGLDDAERALLKRDHPEGVRGIHDIFSGDIVGKMAQNPKLAPYLAQPDLMDKVRAIQQDPSVLNQHMQDPRIMNLMMGLLGVSMGGEGGGFGDDDQPMDQDSPPAAASRPPPAAKSAPAKPPTPEPTELTEEEQRKQEALAEKDLGNQCYKKRQFADALAHYDKAWELDSTNVTILTNKAAVQFEQGEYDACIATCEEAVAVGRDHRTDYKVIAKAFARIGNAYSKKEDLPNAIRYYQKSLTEHRTPDTLNKLKALEKTQREAERQAYLSPELAEKAREAGNAAFKEQNYAEAVKQYTEAIARAPEDPRSYSNRSAAYTKLMAFPEAYKDCETCLALDPKFVKAYVRKANLEFFKKEYTKCLETCQMARDLDTEGRHTHELDQQTMKCYQALNEAQSDTPEARQEAMRRAASDPEIQSIMADPIMQQILQQMQSNPQAVREHMKNPTVSAKINKLINAGIIRVG